MTKYEHTTVVLQFEKRNFAFRKSDVLQGLSESSVQALGELGNEGWELVSVLPYVTGGALRQPATDVAVGFFKRSRA